MSKKTSLLLCICAVILLITTTFAWISFSRREETILLKTGELNYQKSVQFTEESLMYPGDSIGTLNIINKSTIDSQIRVKISYQLNFETPVNLICDNTSLQPLKFKFNEHFRYNSSDQYFYYDASENKNDATLKNYIVPKVSAGNELIISVLEDIILNGNVVDNQYKNISIDLKIVFEIKQTNHLTWEKCADIDFKTGAIK